MARSLDSSRLFKQENYNGTIREMVLEEPRFADTILDHLTERVAEIGYKLENLVIVNVAHGNSGKNEPAGVLLCGNDKGEKGIIIERRFPSPEGLCEEYRFYPAGSWKYIA